MEIQATLRQISEGWRVGQVQPRVLADSSRGTRGTRAILGELQDETSRRSGQPRDKYGAAAPSIAEDGGYREMRWSNSKPGSGWAMRSQSGIGSGSSSQAGGPRVGAIGVEPAFRAANHRFSHAYPVRSQSGLVVTQGSYGCRFSYRCPLGGREAKQNLAAGASPHRTAPRTPPSRS
jgi:hypothetical protein